MRFFRPPVGLLFAAVMLLVAVGWPWARVRAGWGAEPAVQVTRAERQGDSFIVVYDVRNRGGRGAVESTATLTYPDGRASRRTVGSIMGPGETRDETAVFRIEAGMDPARYRYEVSAKAVWRPMVW